MTAVRGDAAGDLLSKGTDALAAEQYSTAAECFDKILTGYPNYPGIDDVRIRAGFTYLHMGKFAEAIDRLAKETDPKAKPEFRGTALYFTGLAQFSQGLALSDKGDTTGSKKWLGDAVNTFTTLIQFITANPTPTNRDYSEDTLYYRALASFQKEDYPAAEKDLKQLLQDFAGSLKRPDYLLLLGSLYAVEANQAVNDQGSAITVANKAQKSPEEVNAIAEKFDPTIRQLAQKAIDTFDQVINDPNALVQANDANRSKAEVLYLIAQLDPKEVRMDPRCSGYVKAIDTFRHVRRKEDMVAIQSERLAQLKKDSAKMLQDNLNAPGGGAALASANSRLIDRETDRLAQLKNGSDPIILSLLRMAECYIAMGQPDEARTILRRLANHPDTTLDAKAQAERQQEMDFQLLYSYTLGGQTDKADAALTAYLSKHSTDPQADSISYQIASKLMERKEYQKALDQVLRGEKDFPNGKFIAELIALQAQALTSLHRVDEARKVIDTFVAQHPDSTVASQILLTKAQGEFAQHDYDKALADYQKVLANARASDEFHAIAQAGVIQSNLSLGKFDDVIAGSKEFATKYPSSKQISSVMVFGALALDHKGDVAGAAAAMQEVAKQYPKDEAAPFALFYVVNIYQRAKNLPGMVEAEKALRAQYPTSYQLIGQAADAVGGAYMADKKFDLAAAEYQPLVNAPKPAVAANAQVKLGQVWLAAAKAMGAYQSMQNDRKQQAEKVLGDSEQAFVAVLKNYPDQFDAVSDAFQGLYDDMMRRRSWGVLTDATMEAYFDKITCSMPDPQMKARVDLAKAGLVFIYKNGGQQYQGALDQFRRVLAANPGLRLTRQEANQYGQLLLWAKDYATATQVYQDLLANAQPGDPATPADAYFGLGSIAMAQGDFPKAKEAFVQIKALPNGGGWFSHILEVDYGIARANELSNSPADVASAKQSYGQLMKNPSAGIVIQAEAMLGYGRILEKEGKVKPTQPGDTENAVSYYEQVNMLFGPAVTPISAEGLVLAIQALKKVGDTAGAQADYAKLKDDKGPFLKGAPDWVAKADALMK